MVPDGLWPPQDPPAASRPSKVGQDQFFFCRRDHYTHEIYNVPLEPERAAEAREARRSCEFYKKVETDFANSVYLFAVHRIYVVNIYSAPVCFYQPQAVKLCSC